MGRLAGLRYRDIAQRLKALGFAFDRQAAGSHEIWFNPGTGRYTTLPFPTIPATCRKARCAPFSNRPALAQKTS
jgi:predicted RNA binding protein YcfA (HicA-like mRNA interferase family)